jgi:hypothetical protein
VSSRGGRLSSHGVAGPVALASAVDLTCGDQSAEGGSKLVVGAARLLARGVCAAFCGFSGSPKRSLGALPDAAIEPSARRPTSALRTVRRSAPRASTSSRRLSGAVADCNVWRARERRLLRATTVCPAFAVRLFRGFVRRFVAVAVGRVVTTGPFGGVAAGVPTAKRSPTWVGAIADSCERYRAMSSSGQKECPDEPPSSKTVLYSPDRILSA